MRLLYLTGEPGVGKSTLMAELTRRCDRIPTRQPVPHDRLIHPDTCRLAAVELGVRRPTFSGTDALSMSVMPAAVEWIGGNPAPLVLAEGDRLASLKFWRPATRAGYSVTALACWTSGEVARERRAQRGSHQSERWVAGRRTKVARLLEAAPGNDVQVLPLNCTPPPAELAAQVLEALPWLKELT